MLFQKTLIIGLGLIGGSFARALRQAKISKEIFACDADEKVMDSAKNSGVIDEFILLQENLSEFDFIILSAPLSSYEEIFEEISNRLSSKAIIIDLGSVKNFKIKNLPKNFIPCHPIAGSDKAGFENSKADLFLDKKFIICPENSDKKSLEKLEEVVKKIGAKAEFLEAKKHDEIYALVSHLPQFLSFLTKEFSPKNIEDEFFKTAFRLDNSSPELWEDIFAMNEKNLEKFYLEFFERLEKNIHSLAQDLAQDGVCNPVLTFSSKQLNNANVWTGLQTPSSDTSSDAEKFFEQNFPAIFFRALVAKSYLEITKIKTFQNYVGTGFIDFTSITKILNYDQEKLRELIRKNHAKILKIFDSIS
jgi:prephenate dehydrogenase